LKQNPIALQQTLARRLAIGLGAGAIATVVNSALLQAASLEGIDTAHGGLLRLTEMSLERVAHLSLPTTPGGHAPLLPIFAYWFQTVFHFATGLFMAELYVIVLEPKVPQGVWGKGVIYGTVVWLFNSFVVLPLIGEGVAGSGHLSLSGIFCFAIAHMAFFISLSIIVQYLFRNTSMNR
jgi:hypothetical protein